MLSVRERPAVAWLVLLLVAVVNYGNFYVYDSIGPVADLLQRQRGFSDTQIGLLNAIYSLPNVVLILVGGVLVDRFGAGLMMVLTGGIMLTVTESGFSQIPLDRRLQAFTANEQGWGMMVGVIEQLRNRS